MYGHPGVGRGAGRPRGLGNGSGSSNENFSNPMYGHSLSQTAPRPPFYSSEMMVPSERRPLQSVQQMQNDNPSLMGKIAQQQLLHSYQNHPQSQPMDSLGRQLSVGFTAGGQDRPHGLGRPETAADFPLSGQLPPTYRQDMGYHPGARSARFSQDPYVDGSGYGEMGGDVWQASSHPSDSGLHYDPPPYSGFTPPRTSTPIRNLRPEANQRYASEYHPQHGAQQPRAAHPGVYQTQLPEVDMWARPARPGALVSFGQPQPRAPTPLTIPTSSIQQLGTAGRSTSASGLSSEAAAYPGAATPRSTASPKPGSAASTPTTSESASPSAIWGTPAVPAVPSATATKKSAGAQAAPPNRGTRVLTGTVDNILTWGRELDEETRPNILFEIVGSLDSVMRSPWYSSRLLSLRSITGSGTLSAVFWEIDRPLFPPPIGSIVSCICRLCPKQRQSDQSAQMQRRLPRMQVIRLRVVGAGQVSHLKRMVQVSSQAVQQGALSMLPSSTSPSASPSSSATPLKQTLMSSYVSSPRTSRAPRE